MTFPLYDILIKDIVDEDLSIDNKKKLIELIPTLNDKEHQHIFALIRVYSLKHNSRQTFDIPYDGQKNNKQVIFNLDKIPNIIKQMIYKFVNIHIDKIKEEEKERVEMSRVNTRE